MISVAIGDHKDRKVIESYTGKSLAMIGRKPSRGEMFLQHVVVFVICVLFPAVVTSYFPASWLTFYRTDDATHCTVRTCLFLVIPYQVRQVADLQSINFRKISGYSERASKNGRTTNEVVHVDGKGYLQLIGADGKIVEVSVSPASIQSVAQKANEFLHGRLPTSRTLFVVANWKFGMLMGGVLSCFTLLYVFGYSVELVKRFVRATSRWKARVRRDVA